MYIKEKYFPSFQMLFRCFYRCFFKVSEKVSENIFFLLMKYVSFFTYVILKCA